MKIAIVYDRVNKWGGAERVLLTLHEMFPDAPLYTSVYDEKRAPWAKVFPKVVTSFLQKIPFAKSNHEFFAPLMPLAFESLDLTGFDLVISVTSEAAKGIIARPGTIHICYCLTPTRYLWNGYSEYFKGSTLKGVLKPVISYLRKWDLIAARRPDELIAISTEVKSRIKKYYGLDSEIIFPSTEPLSINVTEAKAKESYLVVSRLVSYKRVDLAIKAFNNLGYSLTIVGGGREMKKLKRLAKNNIKFVGGVPDSELGQYYQGAKALVMPQEEDFGIVAVEAQSFGVPVIAYKKGGAQDTVMNGKTGILFPYQTVESLIDAVKKFEKVEHKIKFEDCIINSKKFSKERFKKEFAKVVARNVKLN